MDIDQINGKGKNFVFATKYQNDGYCKRLRESGTTISAVGGTDTLSSFFLPYYIIVVTRCLVD